MAENDGDITGLVQGAGAGDDSAAARLLPLVYDELRRLAGAYFVNERGDHTLQPTALVHEAFLQLVRKPDATWESRAHFFRVAALAMRHVLVNHARDRKRLKRGGDAHRVSLDEVDTTHDNDETLDVIALDDAMKKLNTIDPRKEQIVQLRYFGGFTIEETAGIIDLSTAQVKRDWTSARAFLLSEMSEKDPEDPS